MCYKMTKEEHCMYYGDSWKFAEEGATEMTCVSYDEESDHDHEEGKIVELA